MQCTLGGTEEVAMKEKEERIGTVDERVGLYSGEIDQE